MKLKIIYEQICYRYTGIDKISQRKESNRKLR
jgi:hypothetical protein